jgi:hypothetical protein
MSAISCGISGLYFPFMALVDFMGWRLIAMSLLPLNKNQSSSPSSAPSSSSSSPGSGEEGGSKKSTIVYGSDDCGESVHADDQIFLSMAQQLGTSLNLKPRKVMVLSSSSPTESSRNHNNNDNNNNLEERTLFTAVDVEGHKGNDGRYYLLDFSRMFPPTKPDRSYVLTLLLFNLSLF